MTEYWLISAPGDKTCQQTWETLNNVTSKQNTLSVNYKFHIPDLKVSLIWCLRVAWTLKLIKNTFYEDETVWHNDWVIGFVLVGNKNRIARRSPYVNTVSCYGEIRASTI